MIRTYLTSLPTVMAAMTFFTASFLFSFFSLFSSAFSSKISPGTQTTGCFKDSLSNAQKQSCPLETLNTELCFNTFPKTLSQLFTIVAKRLMKWSLHDTRLQPVVVTDWPQKQYSSVLTFLVCCEVFRVRHGCSPSGLFYKEHTQLTHRKKIKKGLLSNGPQKLFNIIGNMITFFMTLYLTIQEKEFAAWIPQTQIPDVSA